MSAQETSLNVSWSAIERFHCGIRRTYAANDRTKTIFYTAVKPLKVQTVIKNVPSYEKVNNLLYTLKALIRATLIFATLIFANFL